MNRIRHRRTTRLYFSIFVLINFLLAQTTFIPSSLAQSTISAEAAHPELQFDSLRNEFTFIDYETNSFAVFPAGDSLDFPLRMGKVEWRGGALRLIPTREIECLGDIYVLSDPRNPTYLDVSEKLPEGGFGRLLRYRGLDDQGEWLDLEFVYDDHGNRLTILDRQRGKFFHTTFTEKRPDPLSVFPRPQDEAKTEAFNATEAPALKFFNPAEDRTSPVIPQVYWLHTQSEILNEQAIWMNRLVRGPPVEEALL